jgi:hypothetical protein
MNKQNLTFKKIKDSENLLHSDSNLVIKSAKERIVIGKLKEGIIIPLDFDSKELCNSFGFEYQEDILPRDQKEISSPGYEKDLMINKEINSSSEFTNKNSEEEFTSKNSITNSSDELLSEINSLVEISKNFFISFFEKIEIIKEKIDQNSNNSEKEISELRKIKIKFEKVKNFFNE